MFITSIHLTNLKRFKKLDLEFPGDITIVKGPNEQGKSTVVEALVAALFYDPQKSNKKIELLRSWNSEKGYSIKLVFEEDGETYELVKDFGLKTASLINRNTGESWKDGKEISELLYRFGGYRSEKLFTSTALVRQESLQEIMDGKKELQGSLEDLISAPSRGGSVMDIVQRIDGRLEEMRKGIDHPAKTPGLLKELEERRSKIEKDLIDLKERTNRIAQNAKELEKKEGEYQRIVGELELKESQLDDVSRYFVFYERAREMDQRLDEISRDIEDLERLESEYQKLVEGTAARGPEMRESDLKELYSRAKEIELEELRVREAQNEEGGEGRTAILSPLLLTVLFILIVAGAAGFFISVWFFGAWIVAVILLIRAVIVPSPLEFGRGKQATARVRTREEKLASLRMSLSGLLNRFGVSTIEEAEKRFREQREATNRVNALAHKQEGILRGRTVEKLREEKRSIEKTLAQGEAGMPKEFSTHPPTSEDKKRLEHAVRDLKKTQDALSERRVSLRTQIQTSAVGSDIKTKLEEELEIVKEELTRISRKERVYRLLRETLLEAKNKAVSGIRKALEAFMSEFIIDITGGKYREITLDENLVIKVLSSEKGMYVVPDEALSRGTVDQLYLVARFSFLKIMTGVDSPAGSNETTGRPLIILDDPFHTFDAERRSRTRELLKRLSRQFQIIFLTHSDEYDTWGVVKTI